MPGYAADAIAIGLPITKPPLLLFVADRSLSSSLLLQDEARSGSVYTLGSKGSSPPGISTSTTTSD
jgi:hypothetical protein